MTELQRQRLLTACAFATVFVQAADMELRGACSEQREDAAEQLIAALKNIDQPTYYTPLDDAELRRIRSIREAFDKKRESWKEFDA